MGLIEALEGRLGVLRGAGAAAQAAAGATSTAAQVEFLRKPAW